MEENGKLWAQLTQIEFEYESDRAIRVHKRGLKEHAPIPDLTDALALALEARHLGEYSLAEMIFGPARPEPEKEFRREDMSQDERRKWEARRRRTVRF